jgi:ubiquinone/menaquinone biosynthesis C-methylase UbiE
MAEKYEGKTRYQDKNIADGYDDRRFVGSKGKWTHKREKECLEKMLEVVPKGEKILELPCGTGRLTEFLLQIGYKVTAADISDEMMRHAKSKTEAFGSKVTFEKADIEKLKYKDNTFSAIAVIRLLHHIPTSLHSKVLGELHRVTKKWVVITYSNKCTFQNIRRNIVAMYTKEPRYSISKKQFLDEVAQAGFKVVEYMPILPFISEEVFVLLEKE